MNSNQCCCHGNTFVKSGSLVKNDQNQQRLKKLKLLPFSTELPFSFKIFSDHLVLITKSRKSYLCQ